MGTQVLLLQIKRLGFKLLLVVGSSLLFSVNAYAVMHSHAEDELIRYVAQPVSVSPVNEYPATQAQSQDKHAKEMIVTSSDEAEIS